MRPEQWAERHDGLITNHVAASAGISDDTMSRRRSSGRYRPMQRGVVAVAGSPITWRQTARAALLSAGDQAAFSHLSAATWQSYRAGDDGTIHLAGPPSRMVRLDGVTWHRFQTLEPGDLITADGARCTSPLRTAIDLSGMLTVPALGDLVDHFVRARKLALETLRERVGRLHAAPGRSVKSLRIVLSRRLPGYDPGESALEARIARIIDQLGLPRPTQQFRVQVDGHRYRIDFAWPDRRLYLEGNGFGFHHLTTDLHRDAVRQNGLVLAGWAPIEVTWIMTDVQIGRTLAAFLTTFARKPAPGA